LTAKAGGPHGPATGAVLGAVIAIAVGLRLAAAAYMGNEVTALPGVADQISYHALALRVLDGHGFSFGTGWWPATPANEPTAHWSYLYVLVLTGVYGLVGPVPLVARLLQASAVGVLQPLLTYRIAFRLFGGRVALVSAALAAAYAYFVYYAGVLLTEPLYIVAILWGIDAAQRLASAPSSTSRGDLVRWLELGVALAVAVLLRQVVLLVVPVVLAWSVWRVRHRRAGQGAAWQDGWRAGVAVAVAVLALAIAPWTVRNYLAFHEFVPLNTNAGFAFYWGNHPIHGTEFIPILPAPVYGQLIPDELKGLNEAQLDKALLRRGMGFVADDPARYAMLSLSRVSEYFRFWPSRDAGAASNAARVLSFGLCLPFFVAGLVTSWTRGPRDVGEASADRADVVLVVGFALVYSMVHFLSWTLVRYRLPVDALMVPFAALAMVQLYDTVSSRLPVAGRAVHS
jgi:4-amino-4-deoxy-L-arabinose transferase-like glycosyltransferase